MQIHLVETELFINLKTGQKFSSKLENLKCGKFKID